MTAVVWTEEEREIRNAALLAAEAERKAATYEAEVEYAETVAKLRERFDVDIAEAARVRLSRVTPAHRAYNIATVAAERGGR
jgi:head-tail adaptor